MLTAKDVACPDADFIEKNGTWVLTVVGLAVGCVGTVLTYFLKSRCSRIACCGGECVREVVKLDEQKTTTSNEGV
jgi:hypothetical protein